MNKKGQTTLEAVLLLIIFVAAGLSMLTYLRRAIQGNWRTNTDSFSAGHYEEGRTKEVDSGIQFIAPRMEVDLGMDNDVDWQRNVGLRSGSAYEIIEIPAWGLYKK